MAVYKKLCGRCLGSGKYDRGSCFGCAGRGYQITGVKPSLRFAVTAVYSDEKRRILRTLVAKDARQAIGKVMQMREWKDFDMNTISAKEMKVPA